MSTIRFVASLLESGDPGRIDCLCQGKHFLERRHFCPDIPSLNLAAKHRHGPAFATLLEVGADLRGPDRNLVRHICKSIQKGGDLDAPDCILRVFMKELVRQRFQLEPSVRNTYGQPADVSVSEMLVRFIMVGAPIDILESLLDGGGANPNAAQNVRTSARQRLQLTPLAAALYAHSAPAYGLLISRGADVSSSEGAANVRSLASLGLFRTITPNSSA